MADETLRPQRNRSINGGVNDRIFAYDINPDQVVSLENIDGSIPGQRRLRPGSVLTATGITNPGPIIALSEYVPRNTTDTIDFDLPTQLLAVTRGASSSDHRHVWSWDGSSTQWTEVGTLTGYTATDEVKITTGLDLLPGSGLEYVAVFSQQAAKPSGQFFYYYDGSALAETSYGSTDSPPNQAPMAFAFNRGFGTGSNRQRSRLFFSDVGQWTVTGFSSALLGFEFGGRSKQRLVAIHQFRSNELIIFLEDKIEKLNVTENNLEFDPVLTFTAPYTQWTRETIDPEIGCGARDSVTSVGQDLYFADQYGNIRSLYRTIQDANQGAESLPISSNIQGTIDLIDPGSIKRIVCRGYNRFLFVGLPVQRGSDAQDVPNEVWRYDVVRQAWDGPWTGLNPWSMAVATFPDSTNTELQNPQLYIGQATGAEGRVIQLSASTQSDVDSSTIKYQEVTRRHSGETIELLQNPQRIVVYAAPVGSATMHVEANCDGMGYQSMGYISLVGNAPLLPQDMPFLLGGGGVAAGQLSLESLDLCRDVQFRFTVSASSRLQVLGYTYLPYIQPYEWDLSS